MKIKIYPLDSRLEQNRLHGILSVLAPVLMGYEDDDGFVIEYGQNDIGVTVMDYDPIRNLRPGTTIAIDITAFSDWNAVGAAHRKSIAEEALERLFPASRFDVGITALLDHHNADTPDMAALERLQDRVNSAEVNMGERLEAVAAAQQQSSRLQELTS